MEKLKLGVAYHGNRMRKHISEDMLDISKHNMNTVVHMYTHNDMDRHNKIMREIFDITKSYGLEVWVDNWGIAGTPGDKCHFLGFHPESRRVYSDGSIDPIRVCFNSPAFVAFSKEWIEFVKEAGGEVLFWDEPHLKSNKSGAYACYCPVCQSIFKEKYGYDMPAEINKDVLAFQNYTVANYMKIVSEYAHSMDMKNSTCIEPGHLAYLDEIIKLPYIENIGTDPYWPGGKGVEYSHVYTKTKPFVDRITESGKDSHIWLKTFCIEEGCEEEIYLAADAAYDAGARTILAWAYRGSEANNATCDNCEMVWNITGDAMRRLRDRYQAEKREELRKIMEHK